MLTNFKQNSKGAFSVVNTLGDIKLGTTVGKNNATIIPKSINTFDVVSAEADRKSEVTLLAFLVPEDLYEES